MLVNYYGIRCTYERYKGKAAIAAEGSYEPELLRAYEFKQTEGRWLHFLTDKEETAVLSVYSPNGSITFDDNAVKYCVATLILFLLHLAAVLVFVCACFSYEYAEQEKPLSGLPFVFITLIASIVLAATVRVKYRYSRFGKMLSIAIFIVCGIEMAAAVILACVVFRELLMCIDTCSDCGEQCEGVGRIG